MRCGRWDLVGWKICWLAQPPAFQAPVRAALPARDQAGPPRRLPPAPLGEECDGARKGQIPKVKGHFCLLLLKRFAQAREAGRRLDRQCRSIQYGTVLLPSYGSVRRYRHKPRVPVTVSYGPKTRSRVHLVPCLGCGRRKPSSLRQERWKAANARTFHHFRVAVYIPMGI